MKIQTTIILLCLLLAVAQGQANFVYWAGNWDIAQAASSDTACYPENTISIEQTVTQLTASWVWAKTQPCQDAGIAGKKFTQTVDRPAGNSIKLQFTIGKVTVDGTFTVSTTTAFFKSNNGASATCIRRNDLVYFPGTWDIVTQDKTLCNPDKSITLTQQDATHVQASWTWDNSDACQKGGLAGKKFDQTIALTTENAVLVSFQAGGIDVTGAFAVVNDQALFISVYGGSASFARRQESVNWVGTWNIETQQAGKGCFPDTSLVITKDGDSLTAKWTWANSPYCQGAGLAGKEFTYTEPIPRGRSIFLGFILETTIVSGIFTVDGDKATFASNTGSSATFNRKSSGLMGIIIVILLIVAVAAGGYFFVQRNKTKKLQGDLNSSLAGVYGRT
jgi:hypothetical protein